MDLTARLDAMEAGQSKNLLSGRAAERLMRSTTGFLIIRQKRNWKYVSESSI